MDGRLRNPFHSRYWPIHADTLVFPQTTTAHMHVCRPYRHIEYRGPHRHFLQPPIDLVEAIRLFGSRDIENCPHRRCQQSDAQRCNTPRPVADGTRQWIERELAQIGSQARHKQQPSRAIFTNDPAVRLILHGLAWMGRRRENKGRCYVAPKHVLDNWKITFQSWSRDTFYGHDYDQLQCIGKQCLLFGWYNCRDVEIRS
jgi:hypothetical protein